MKEERGIFVLFPLFYKMKGAKPYLSDTKYYIYALEMRKNVL